MTAPAQSPGAATVHAYHDGTKHHFHRFARSLGYLDWASQPNPFRSFAGSRELGLFPRPDASPSTKTIGYLLRHALGLSAWKEFRGSRWSLRVNPSSGNLHPTEAYVVMGPLEGVTDAASVYHYAPDRHALEQRCVFDRDAWSEAIADDSVLALVALASIHWREAWKYGERAFRYCQHDLGHAAAAVRIASGLVGCRAVMLPDWSQPDIASLTGIDRDEDYVEAEREEAGCLLAVAGRKSPVTGRQSPVASRCRLIDAVRAGRWSGRASQLSEEHIQWTFIDEVAEATRDPGRPASPAPFASLASPAHSACPAPPAYPAPLLLQRRSALALDGRSSIDAAGFYSMLAQAMATPESPFDVLWWTPRVHLALFVHRVDDVEPGLYVLARYPRALDPLKAACRPDFLWIRAHDELPLFQLARGDCRRLAERLSCDQEIAADGFFSLGMLAEFDASLAELGPSFYRHLFWESGVVGHALYLAAEAAGARGTGIGCFYDDPVHEVLGIADHSFQSLYHFTIGIPVEDRRLTSAPGYWWERTET